MASDSLSCLIYLPVTPKLWFISAVLRAKFPVGIIEKRYCGLMTTFNSICLFQVISPQFNTRMPRQFVYLLLLLPFLFPCEELEPYLVLIQTDLFFINLNGFQQLPLKIEIPEHSRQYQCSIVRNGIVANVEEKPARSFQAKSFMLRDKYDSS